RLRRGRGRVRISPRARGRQRRDRRQARARRHAGALDRSVLRRPARADRRWGARAGSLLKPTVVIVGRPNVGKSTLFNRLTRSRDALVADLPGLTRDRHYGQGRLGEKPFVVVDTGGFEPVAKDGILERMARQTREAIAEADVVLFVTDARAGLA